MRLKKCVIVSTGSIGVQMLPTYAIEFHSNGIDVKFVMTKAATAFIKPDVLEPYGAVITDVIDGQVMREVPHVSLGEWADAIFYMPCSANTIAKLANGICDNFATLLALTTNSPIAIFPSMNRTMSEKAITQLNMQSLVDRGYWVDRELKKGYSVSHRQVEMMLTIPAPKKVLSVFHDLTMGKDLDSSYSTGIEMARGEQEPM